MNPLQGSGVSERSRCGAVRILGIGRVGALSLWCSEPSTGIGRVGALSLWCRAHPCREPIRAVRILELADGPSTGIGRVGRCGAVRILAVADEPSTGIGRVGALSLWCRAHPGEPSASGVSDPLRCVADPCRGRNPLQGSGVSERSRCGAVRILELADEPSTGIGRVGSLAGEPSAGIGVVPCASLPWPLNPLQGSGVSDRSPANPLRGSVWCRAHPCRGR